MACPKKSTTTTKGVKSKFLLESISHVVKKIKPVIKSHLKKRTNAITPSSCNYDITTDFSMRRNSTESYFYDDNLGCCDETADNAINERLESLENEKNEKLEKELLSKLGEKNYFLQSEPDKKIISNVYINNNNNNHYKYVRYGEREHFCENSYMQTVTVALESIK